MDNEAIIIFSYIIITVLSQMMELFGIVTNIINIICFIKQGFKESVNVSLFGLAVSDLASLITQIMASIWLTPAVNTADLSFEVIGVYYLTAGVPHLTTTRVASWMTAIITMERALCVIAPLQVNRILTPKRVSVIMACVTVFLVTSMTPVYVVNKLEMKFISGRNKTILGITFTAERETVEKISFIINNFLIPFIAFVVTIICTIILVVCLQRRKIFLQSATTQSNPEISVRNQRVTKMVVMISALFISCFVPMTIIMLSIAFEPRLAVGGEYINLSILIGCTGFFLESINSSSNIFIYYKMSSKYRDTFHTILGKCCRRRIRRSDNVSFKANHNTHLC